jgi:hypothetical protein
MTSNRAFETDAAQRCALYGAAQRGRYTCLMRTLAVALVVACASLASHAAGVWTPEVKFKLENSSYAETLLWVSGFSYALTETAKASSNASARGPYCLPPQGLIGSRELLEILNGRFPGKAITSEVAAAALVAGVKARFPCK